MQLETLSLKGEGEAETIGRQGPMIAENHEAQDQTLSSLFSDPSRLCLSCVRTFPNILPISGRSCDLP